MRRFKVDPKREVRAPETRPGRAGAILHGSKADQVCLLSGNPFGNGGVSFCKSTPEEGYPQRTILEFWNSKSHTLKKNLSSKTRRTSGSCNFGNLESLRRRPIREGAQRLPRGRGLGAARGSPFLGEKPPERVAPGFPLVSLSNPGKKPSNNPKDLQVQKGTLTIRHLERVLRTTLSHTNRPASSRKGAPNAARKEPRYFLGKWGMSQMQWGKLGVGFLICNWGSDPNPSPLYLPIETCANEVREADSFHFDAFWV